MSTSASRVHSSPANQTQDSERTVLASSCPFRARSHLSSLGCFDGPVTSYQDLLRVSIEGDTTFSWQTVNKKESLNNSEGAAQIADADARAVGCHTDESPPLPRLQPARRSLLFHLDGLLSIVTAKKYVFHNPP